MQDFKLTKILQGLSKSEMKRFGDMVASPLYNKNDKLIKLQSFYQKHHPEFDQKSFSIEKASQYVLGNKSTDKEPITKLSSKLIKLFEQFLTIDSTTSIEKDLILLNFYFKEGQYNLFKNKIRQIEKALLQGLSKDENTLTQLIQLFRLKRKFFIKFGDSGKGDSLLNDIDELIDEKYQLEKLKNIVRKHNRRSIVKFDFDRSTEPAVLEYAKSKSVSNSYFQIWLGLYDAFNSENDADAYGKIKQIILTQFESLSAEDKNSVGSFLQNLPRRHLGTGDDYFKEVFDLYKFRYDTNTLIEGNEIYSATVMNIIRLGTYLKEYDFMDRFLEDIKDAIKSDENEKEDIAEYANAHIAFSKEDYESALSLLNQTKLHNIFLKLEEKRLRLLIYYKMDIFDIIDDNINALRKFLSVNKNVLSDFQLEANRNFLSIYSALIKLRKNDKRQVDKLKADIEQTKALPFRSWFLKELG